MNSAAALNPAVAGLPSVPRFGPLTEPDDYVFVPRVVLDEQSQIGAETLLAFLPLVQAAIEDDTDGTVGEATPVSYDLGQGVTAAGYELTVEYPL